MGFALLNGRLPRPASATSHGKEISGQCDTEAACTGFLPWATLGVRGTDSWGKLLRYSVTPSFANARIQPYTAVANKTVLGRSNTGELFYRAGQRTCAIGSQCSPAVIFSSGKNNLGTGSTGIALANGTIGNYDELSNNSAANQFLSRAKSEQKDSAGGEFDDMVVWMSLQYLFRQMSAAGTFR